MQGGRKSLVSWDSGNWGWHVVSVPRGSSWLALLHIIPLLLGSPSPLETPAGFVVLLLALLSLHEQGGSHQWLRILPSLWEIPCASPLLLPSFALQGALWGQPQPSQGVPMLWGTHCPLLRAIPISQQSELPLG